MHPRTLGEFQLVRELGRGGMGVVWLAVDGFGREVALKVAAAFGPEEQLRFQREVEALGALRHPGVVGVHASGRAPGGEQWVACELVPGRDLHSVVEEDGPLPPLEAARVIRELADALAAVHAAGLVHRDLKPRNAILRPDGRAVLIDFGLVRGLDAQSLTVTGEILGTPAYMAPEQARGGKADARADVWSLAATLGYLLVGRPPFAGQNPVATLMKVIEGRSDWPVPLGPDVPPALEAVIRKGMSLDPAARFANGAELRDALMAGFAPTRSPARLGLLGWIGGVAAFLAALALSGAWLGKSADPAPVSSAGVVATREVTNAPPLAAMEVSWPARKLVRKGARLDLEAYFVGEWVLSVHRPSDEGAVWKEGASRLDRATGAVEPERPWEGYRCAATDQEGRTFVALVRPRASARWRLEWRELERNVPPDRCRILAEVDLRDGGVPSQDAWLVDMPVDIGLWTEGDRARVVVALRSLEGYRSGSLFWLELERGRTSPRKQEKSELGLAVWDLSLTSEGQCAWVAVGREGHDNSQAGGQAQRWRAGRASEELASQEFGPRAIQVDADRPDRSLVCNADLRLELVDGPGHRQLVPLRGGQVRMRGAVLLTHSGRSFALGAVWDDQTDERELWLWPLAEDLPNPTSIGRSPGGLTSLAISWDRRCIALAGADGGVELRSVESLLKDR